MYSDDLVKILIVIIGLMGCIIIWLMQHRKDKDSEVVKDYVSGLLGDLKKLKDETEQEFYGEYIDNLIKLTDKNVMVATEAFYKIIDMVDSHLPFFKTGYISTLVLGESRYMDLIMDMKSFDVNKHIERLEELKEVIKSSDLEELANETLVMLRWFKDTRMEDSK